MMYEHVTFVSCTFFFFFLATSFMYYTNFMSQYYQRFKMIDACLCVCAPASVRSFNVIEKKLAARLYILSYHKKYVSRILILMWGL